MAFSHISQYEYKSTNYLFISTTNRLLLIPLTMNADNHDASEVSSPSSERGFPLSEATCATEFSLPLPSITETRRGVCILADTTTARNKRLIAIASEATLGILNQHQTYLYMDGTI